MRLYQTKNKVSVPLLSLVSEDLSNRSLFLYLPNSPWVIFQWLHKLLIGSVFELRQNRPIFGVCATRKVLKLYGVPPLWVLAPLLEESASSVSF